MKYKQELENLIELIRNEVRDMRSNPVDSLDYICQEALKIKKRMEG